MNRSEALLARLTLEEKVSMCAGSDRWCSTGVPRLGIPRFKMSDGPNGARGSLQGGSRSAACFPAGVALAATWNAPLLEAIGGALAEEAQSKGAHVLLAPTINLQRTPIGGRNFECYSEDPHLTAGIATAFVRGLQRGGVGACLKHFVANDTEVERRAISSNVAERPLRELYLRPFELAIRDADPWCVMSAYNRVNGVYAASSRELLTDILKDEWGFSGVVVSDWGGCMDTTADARAGLDLEMPGPARRMGEKLLAAVREGAVAEAQIDDKVRRILRLLERAGLLDAAPDVEERADDRPAHRALAGRAAAESMVLLQNRGLLPLDAGSLRRVAVLGPNAEPGQIMGGGSAFVVAHYHVSPLAGLRERLGAGVEVAHEPACSIPFQVALFESAQVRSAGGEPGFDVEYWEGESLAGTPVARAVATQSQIFFGRTPPDGITGPVFAARYTARFTPVASGVHELGIRATGRSRLFLDGREVVDNWTEPTWTHDIFGAGISTERRASVALEAGRSYELRVEWIRKPEPTLAILRFGVLAPDPGDMLDRAVAAAAAADVAIVVAGTNGDWESEGRDRPSLDLPGRQRELIERVAAVQPRTLVVLNSGSPVTLDWSDRVPAVLCAWFPGQELGNALADVVFGDVNPSGRLPITFPRRLQDTPAFTAYPGERGEMEYAEGLFVGYRWYDRRALEPAFAFGHGLSYTEFRYGPLRASPTHSAGDSLVVTCDVTNVGARAGQEVVQLYVGDVQSTLARPDRELRAFTKLELAPGETRTARFVLDDRAFEHWDPAAHAWRLEPGEFELCAGASSRDLRARTRVVVK